MSFSGTITKFWADKGFGFIRSDEGDDDVFAHVKENPDLKGCTAGDAVKYDINYGGRKHAASASRCGDGGGGKSGGKGKG